MFSCVFIISSLTSKRISHRRIIKFIAIFHPDSLPVAAFGFMILAMRHALLKNK